MISERRQQSQATHVLDERTTQASGAAADDAARRVCVALAAIRALAAELTVTGRARRAVELAPSLVGARWGAVAVRGVDGSIQEWLFSTADPAEVSLLQAALEGREVNGNNFAVLSAPVHTPSGLYADLYVVARLAGDEFSSGDEQVLEQFASTAGVGVDNATQYEQSRKRQGWLSASGQVSQGLLEFEQDEKTVWQQIADAVHRLTQARTVTISTPSEDDDDDLEVRVAAGLGAEQLTGLCYPRVGSLAEQAMTTGALRLDSASRYRISDAEVVPEVPVGPVLALPLRGQGFARGAILVSRCVQQSPFTLTDSRLAENFANQAAIALELAETRAAQQRLELREDVERIAETFQDQVVQRLFSIGLRLKAAAARQEDGTTAPWLSEVIDDLDTTIAKSRASLSTSYRHLSPPPPPSAT